MDQQAAKDRQQALEKFAELQKQMAELDDYLFKAPPAGQHAPSSGSCPEPNLATHKKDQQAAMDHQTAWEKMAEVQAALADYLFKAPPAGQPTPSSGSCPELAESSGSESETQSVAKLSSASSGSSWHPRWRIVEPPSWRPEDPPMAYQGAWIKNKGGRWADENQDDASSEWRCSSCGPGTLLLLQ